LTDYQFVNFYKKLRITIVIIFVFLISAISAKGQITTWKLELKRGANVDFIFNRYDLIKNGITLEFLTEINIICAGNPSIPPPEWELTVEALENELLGFDITNKIELDKIKLNVYVDDVLSVESPVTLDRIAQVIASKELTTFGANQLNKIKISYFIEAGALKNKFDDFYRVNLRFFVAPKP